MASISWANWSHDCDCQMDTHCDAFVNFSSGLLSLGLSPGKHWSAIRNMQLWQLPLRYWGESLMNLVLRFMKRLRPFERYAFLPLLGHERGHSFPSNHATGALALSVSMFSVPFYGHPLLLLAILLSIARVYTGLHHMTDVMAGVLHGVFWAVLCLTLYSVYRSRSWYIVESWGAI